MYKCPCTCRTCDVTDLVLVAALGDELVSDLDPGLQQVGVQHLTVDTDQLGDALTLLRGGEATHNVSTAPLVATGPVLRRLMAIIRWIVTSVPKGGAMSRRLWGGEDHLKSILSMHRP